MTWCVDPFPAFHLGNISIIRIGLNMSSEIDAFMRESGGHLCDKSSFNTRVRFGIVLLTCQKWHFQCMSIDRNLPALYQINNCANMLKVAMCKNNGFRSGVL